MLVLTRKKDESIIIGVRWTPFFVPENGLYL